MIGRSSLITVLAITLISITAAGSDAAVFSFVDSVKEFLGIETVSASSAQRQPNGPNGALNAAPTSSDQRGANYANEQGVPQWLADQQLDYNKILQPGLSDNLLAGTALQFNGSSQYATLGTATQLRSATFTVELWFKRTGAGAGTGTGTGGITSAIPLITKGRAEAETAAADVNYFFGIDATSGKLVADFEEAQVAQGGTSPGLNHPITGTAVIAADNMWHHAAATFDGTTWNLYLDGNLDSTLAVNRPANALTNALTSVGSARTTGGVAAGFFAGVVDEVRIWNSARSLAQIQATKDLEITTPQSGLLGVWNLNEGSGTSLADNSGNSVTGAALGSPTWVGGFPIPDAIPPARPTGLAATPGNTAVSLTWTANSEADLSGYNIYRSTTSPVPLTSPINGGTLVTGTTYNDTGRTNGQIYYYVITAVDMSTNESDASDQVNAIPAVLPGALEFTTATGTYVTFGDPAKLDLATFTIETWFKRTGAGTSNTTGTGGITIVPLLTHGSPEAENSSVDANWILGINTAGNVIAADFEAIDDPAPTGQNFPISGTTAITDNVWHHAAATFDGTTWAVYLDGNLEASSNPGVHPRSDSIQPVALGTMIESNGTPHGYFRGVIDEARVWNVARTQSQIVADKNNELTSGSGLVARWGLNEGTGTVVGDSVSTAANGTITGSNYTWVTPGAPFNVVPSNPPEVPTLNSPANGSTGVGASTTLDVGVSDLDGGVLTVTFFGRPYASGVFAQIGQNTGVASGSNTTKSWTGLDSGQKFEWYATVSDGASTTTGPTWTFDTSPGADPVFVGVGDIASCSVTEDTATGELISGIEGTIFTTGDNVYPNGTAADFANCYATTPWGNPSVLSRTRPVPGNHDWGTGVTNNLDGYFGNYGDNANQGGTSYYAYDLDSYWHVVNLDSECQLVPGGCGVGSPQEVWLRADLAANAGKNVIAVWHKPRYSSGATNYQALQPLWDALYEAGADILLDGHDHIYERFVPIKSGATLSDQPVADPVNGIRQFTVGMGGESHHAFGTTLSTSEVRNNTDYGVFKLTLHPTSYDWKFFPIAGSTFADSGSATINAPANTSVSFQDGVNNYTGTSDTYTFDVSPSTVRGAETTIVQDKNPANTPPDERRSLLRFDLSSIPASATIVSAELKFYVDAEGQGFNMHRMNVPWSEATTSFASLGNRHFAADDIDAESSVNANWPGVDTYTGPITVSVPASTVQAWVNGTVANNGWLMIATHADDGQQLRSREYATVADRPKLTVVYDDTPVPNVAPDQPVLVSPADNATGVSTSPNLDVTASDPNGDNLTVTYYGRPVGTTSPGADFTVVAMPDTQHYTDNGGANAAKFAAQTQWIVDNKNALNIKFVTGLGDIVENGNAFDSEWQIATNSYATIENPATTGLLDGIPYGLAVGNHDESPLGGGDTADTAKYNQYFGISRFNGRGYYGGHFGSDNDNNYELFSAGGMDFIIVHFEYDTTPDPALLTWADGLLQAYPGRRAIAVTHNLIGTGNPGSFSSQGAAIYNELKDRPNLFLMLGGHVPGEGRRQDTFGGKTVYSLLSDYQSRANGGDGWLRVMTFSPANNTISVKTYSPTLNQFETDADSQFTLSYDMAGTAAPFAVIGTNTNVPSGTNTSVNWPGLTAGTEYEWYATVSDGVETTTGPVWSFTTQPAVTTFTLDYAAGTGGTLTGDTSQVVNSGANGTQVTAVPDAGYHFVSWSDGVLTASRTDLNVTANLNVTATFALDEFSLTLNASNGSVTPDVPPNGVTDTAKYLHGTVVTLTPAADAGYHFTGWSGDCTGTGACQVTMTAARTVTATFAIDTYTVTVSAGTGGSISPTGAVVVNYGDTPMFTITPAPGYDIADVLVDGVSVGAVGSYQFAAVGSDHTISATFTPVNTYAVSGNIQQYNSPAANTNLAGVSVTLSGDQTGSTTTDSDGNYSFTGLPPGGSYLITPSLAGYAFDPISRSYSNVTANVTAANFTGLSGNSPRIIKVVSQNVAPGAQAVVPISIVSQGDENSLGFSVTYDPLVLNTPVIALGADCLDCFLIPNVSAGQIGVIVSKPALPAPVTFAAGTRQVVTITFNTTGTPPAFKGSAVTFGDSPISREVANANADSLLATYSSGVVTFATGYEADVAPRFSGSNTGIITVSDYNQTGLFAAGLNTVNPLYNELQRADSAPRATRGNGLITVSDYNQAGRYAAGLDGPQPVGGTAFASLFSPEEFVRNQKALNALLLPRVLYAADASTSPGQQVTVSIRIDANGDENAFGFTVSYDPTVLSNPSVTIGADLPGSNPIANALTAGKVGVITAWPVSGGTIPAGTREIVKIRFDVSPTAGSGATPIVFTGHPPVANEVSDASANELPTTFTAGNVTILGPTAASTSVGGIVLSADGMAINGARLTLTSASGLTRSAISNPFGFFRFDDVAIGETYVVNVRAREYTFAPRLLNVTDEVTNLNLVAEP